MYVLKPYFTIIYNKSSYHMLRSNLLTGWTNIHSDHARTIGELPDEYLSDIGPLLKKVALSTGVEQYNVLQVGTSFIFGLMRFFLSMRTYDDHYRITES